MKEQTPKDKTPNIGRAKPKKFYKQASYKRDGDLFVILLDERPVKTPMKAPLALPFEQIAKDIAGEWNDQGEFLEPEKMTLTKYANTAIDRVSNRRSEVIDELLKFGEFDLLFYLSPEPADLASKQKKSWGGVLSKLEEIFDLPIQTTTGLTPLTQDEKLWAQERDHFEALNDYQLTGVYNIASLTKSCLLSLAFHLKLATSGEIWGASILDEEWQSEIWGRDEEAEARRQDHRRQLERAAYFYQLST